LLHSLRHPLGILEHVACRRDRLLRGPDLLLSPCHVLESLYRLEYLGGGFAYLDVDLGHPCFQAAQALFKLLTLVILRAPCRCAPLASTLGCLPHILGALADFLIGVTLLFSDLAETFRLSAFGLCLQTPTLCLHALGLGMGLLRFCRHGGDLHVECVFDSLPLLFFTFLSVCYGFSFFGV
jgi:hypothetical protein